MTSELRPGTDRVLEHTPGRNVPAPAARVSHLRRTHVRTERGVLIVSGLDADGRLCWVLSAIEPRSADLFQAWVYDRREVQTYVDQFSCLASARR